MPKVDEVETERAASETTATTATAIRPTKKQRALLDFIQSFIDEHGYSPSYREIMNGCGYNSIATVAVHINNLITRGHLRKRDHSARSLELTRVVATAKPQAEPETGTESEPGEAWLSTKVDALFDRLESGKLEEFDPDDLQSIVTAFELLGLKSAADQFAERLANID